MHAGGEHRPGAGGGRHNRRPFRARKAVLGGKSQLVRQAGSGSHWNHAVREVYRTPRQRRNKIS